MKKSIITLGLVGVLTLGLSASAFASDASTPQSTCKFNENKITCVEKLMNEGKTFEEAKTTALENRYSKIDAAVEKGKITAEKATELKNETKEKFDACTSVEEFKELHQQFNLNKELNGNKKGNKNGNGKHSGKGNGTGGCKLNGTENPETSTN